MRDINAMLHHINITRDPAATKMSMVSLTLRVSWSYMEGEVWKLSIDFCVHSMQSHAIRNEATCSHMEPHPVFRLGRDHFSASTSDIGSPIPSHTITTKSSDARWVRIIWPVKDDNVPALRILVFHEEILQQPSIFIVEGSGGGGGTTIKISKFPHHECIFFFFSSFS